MNATISLNWTSEAGPRQTKEVQNALQTLRYAGSGTKVLSTSLSTGIDSKHVESTFGSSTDDEDEHSVKRKYAEMELHDSYGGLITRENFRSIIGACEMGSINLRACQPVRDERTTPAQRAKILQDNNARAQKSTDDYAAEHARRETEADAVAKDYPYLTRLKEGRYASGAEVAKNIRIILKADFPGVKFSVRSDNNSVNINWTDGPTADAVDSKAGLFKAGHFDGMEDIYEDTKSAFTDAFGSVKYIFTSRDYRDGLRDTVKAAISADRQEADDYELDRRTNEALNNTDLTGKGDYTGLSFDYEEQRYALDFLETIQTVPAQAASTAGTPGAPCAYTVEKHYHTKKEKDYFLCIASDRMERDDFNAERDRAKGCGGWYSRAWQGTPGGFAFWTNDEAAAFAGAAGTAPDGATKPPAPRPDRSNKLRETADKMQSTIDSKRAPMTQNATPKRTLQYKSRRIEGDHLERVQKAFYAIADGLEAGTLPAILQGVSTKAELLRLTTTRTDGSRGYYEILDTGEYTDKTPQGVALQTLIDSVEDPEAEERKTAQLIEDKILAFAGVKIPGFFVTHKEAAERVIYEADIQPGELVLEPSAGTGNLADLARDVGGTVNCLEIRPALCEILKLKGFNTVCNDFMDYNPGRADKIVMNPPFENGQDGEHVRKAYNHLNEGGRLVAIMGEGSFFRSDSKAVAFRGWLDNKGGTSEKLPEGSFSGAGEVNQTGTNTRIVIIEK